MARVLELTTRLTTLSRGDGRSATAAAAYRACCVIDCEREGRTHDYRRKAGLVVAEIVLPAGAPAWGRDRAKLWNAAELRETNKDKRAKSAEKANARVARDYLFTFPDELSPEGRLNAARAVAGHLVDTHGVAVDFAIHQPGGDGDQRNFHCHMMFTTRRMTAKGLGEKTREWDDRPGKAGGEPGIAKDLRARVAKTLNEALTAEGKGALVHVEHRTFKARGSGQKPQTHQGPNKTHELRKKQERDRSRWNEDMRQALRQQQAQQLASLALRQQTATQARIAELARRGREGIRAIRDELARQRRDDMAPAGLRRAFLFVTGRAMREAFDRQTRDAQRLAIANERIGALMAGLKAERRNFITEQARDWTALTERHAAEDRQLVQSLEHRLRLDRGMERRVRTPANDRTLVRDITQEIGARSIGRELGY